MEEKLDWKILNKLWEESKPLKDKFQSCYDYWLGKYEAPKNHLFSDQKITSCNIVKEIVEAKLYAMLDAQFSTAVKGELTAFMTTEDMKSIADLADIYQEEMQAVLKRNKWDSIKENAGRWGLVGGAGMTQVCIDKKNEQFDVTLNKTDPRYVRIDKSATKLDEITYIGYEIQLSPFEAKERYAKLEDGSYDKEICKLIDAITEDVAQDIKKGNRKGIVATQNSSTNTADLAFAYDNQGIISGKVVKLIMLCLQDDSVYAPDTKDDVEKEAQKQELLRRYPYGRLVVFSLNKEKKAILEDKPAPKGYDNKGNIEFFRPVEFAEIIDNGEVEDLKPIQDRINGTMLKIRELVAKQINTIAIDKGLNLDLSEGDLVNQAVTFLEGIANSQAQLPPVLNNGSIEEAMKLITYKDSLIDDAYRIARVNDTMINGVRQQGTTSGEQVEALQESPMASIRGIQRNFKQYVVGIGEKILTLIQEYYTMRKLVEFEQEKQFGGITAKMARFVSEGDNRFIELLDRKGKALQTIKVNPEYKFTVEVVAGTEIPRSRRESSYLIEKLYKDGTLGDPNDIDVKEIYLRALDVPNYRAFISLMKKKQEELQNNPYQPDYKEILKTPDLAKAFSEMLKALEFNSSAKSLVLQAVGIPLEESETDTLDTAPAQTVASRSDVKETGLMVPDQISKDELKQGEGQEIAGAMIDQKEGI